LKKPTINQLVFEIYEYASKNNYKFTLEMAKGLAEDFIDYYETIGWKVGQKRMVSWQYNIKRWVRKNWHAKNFSKGPDGLTFRERELKRIKEECG